MLLSLPLGSGCKSSISPIIHSHTNSKTFLPTSSQQKVQKYWRVTFLTLQGYRDIHGEESYVLSYMCLHVCDIETVWPKVSSYCHLSRLRFMSHPEGNSVYSVIFFGPSENFHLCKKKKHKKKHHVFKTMGISSFFGVAASTGTLIQLISVFLI